MLCLDGEVTLHGHDDASLGRPVQLGQHDAGDVHDVTEDAGLHEPVLTGGGVEDEQHLGDGRLLLDHALDLAELVHQPGLVLQSPRRVDDHRVDAGLDPRAHGFVGDAGGI